MPFSHRPRSGALILRLPENCSRDIVSDELVLSQLLEEYVSMPT